MNMDGTSTSSDCPGIESPLLNNFVGGAVDYKGRPVLRSKSGSWRSAYFICGVGLAERFAYNGVSSNLITYLTGPLGQSTAKAAEIVNAWSGTALLLPLVGAFIADAFLGRYLTIIIASLLYVLALALLAFSTLIPSDCTSATDGSSCSPQLQFIIFFISLYLVAFAQGGQKPCVEAFGADQYDVDDPEELKSKSSFFNWWFFGLCSGPTIGIFVLSYVQDNISWGLGFGIPCVIMGFALVIFLFGTMTYRFGEKTQEKNLFRRISHVFVTAARNWRFLNKVLVSPDGSNEDVTVCSADEVEEAKAVLRLIPIWVSCLAYGIVFSQTSTLFTKQGATMDRSMGSTFEIPPATQQSFINLSVIILIPIYDMVIVPLTRAITNIPSGITMLQRIGTGLFISIVSMVVAAIVETKRLNIARKYGLLDDPNAMIPMKIWWLLPQCLLARAGGVFTIIGMQEFFYDQMPRDLKSIGLALYLSVLGIGSFLSSFIISIIDKTTGGNDQDGWISDNLNQGHVDYFYYLVAGISAGAFVIFIYAAKSYVYKGESGM
ncbi:putative proton-dependent oligopeptide transporter family, PTR2 family proton/oligopeptide symporter [Helianthus debilis subsp. tardiflorus]